MEHMCEPQPVELDCRIKSCIFNREGGVCITQPQITLNQNGDFFCWTKFEAEFSDEEQKEKIIDTIKENLPR